MDTNQKIVWKTHSVCPVCTQVITANLIEQNNQVRMVKTCAEHGQFDALYWNDAEHYLELMKLQPLRENTKQDEQDVLCPYECGLCDMHRGSILIALVDVTNRCDLACPICLANSSAKVEHLYELSSTKIEEMLIWLKTQGTAEKITVQFSGGEPTLRDDLPELIALAKRLGFGRVEVNTHGIRIAQDPAYAKLLVDAGLDAIGLQFDGMDDQIYQFTRGKDLMTAKKQAIISARAAGLSVILVVTLVKGVNDEDLGNILRFAADNRDVVKRVIGQTLTFVGRGTAFSEEELRITLFDFARLVEQQTDGAISIDDFYPVTAIMPVPEFLEALTGKHQDKLLTHPCCDLATYIYIDDDGKFIPLNKLLPVRSVLQIMSEGAKAIQSSNGIYQRWIKIKYVLRLVYFALAKIRNPVFRQLIINALKQGDFDPMEDLENVLMVSCTSHMDLQNFDIERVETCAIHYLVPEEKLIPFCSYNTFYRQQTEEGYAKRSHNSSENTWTKVKI